MSPDEIRGAGSGDYRGAAQRIRARSCERIMKVSSWAAGRRNGLGVASSAWPRRERPAATSNLGVMWFGFQRLDRELTAIGAPGCTLLCTIEIDFGVAWNNGSTQAVSIPVPNDPALAGGHVFVQVVHADPAANAVGVVLSDALNLAVGL